MCLRWLKKIGFKAEHNAFVDLCEFQQQLFCCYREANNHVSANGVICILRMDMLGNIQQTQRISIAQTDLRDPKLSVTPTGQLLLVAYARLTTKDNQTISTQNLAWVSQTGHSWSSFREFAKRGWWLWRVRWHQDKAYGFAYNRKQNAIDFYAGDPRRTFHRHQAKVLSLEKHGKGYPNESDVLFENNNAFALVRRDADSYSAQLGKSTFPFKKWNWTDLGAYIGGPVMLPLEKGQALVAGRIIKHKKLVTGLLKLNLANGHLQLLMILPSTGDNSYPGLVIKEDTLYVSYYSSHQDNKSCVYLAQIVLSELLS